MNEMFIVMPQSNRPFLAYETEHKIT